MATIISAHGHRSIWSFLLTRAIPRNNCWGAFWGEWRTRRRYRSDLKRLLRVGSYMIEDVGLSVEEAKREIQKPFWQA
jgi:uncharacterized protein YjiS (DUF1127 family)